MKTVKIKWNGKTIGLCLVVVQVLSNPPIMQDMGDSRNSRDLNSEVLAENWTLRFKIAEKEAEITSLNATAKVLFMCQ